MKPPIDSAIRQPVHDEFTVRALPPACSVKTIGVAATARSAMIRAIVETLSAFPQSLLQLLMRIAIMPVFWRSGWAKAENMEQAIDLFRDEYRLPILPAGLAAYLGTAVELTAPALILAGFATRLATLPLIALTLTIQFLVYPVSYPDHLLWFAILVFILTRGPGPISIDALLASRTEPPNAAILERPR